MYFFIVYLLFVAVFGFLRHWFEPGPWKVLFAVFLVIGLVISITYAIIDHRRPRSH